MTLTTVCDSEMWHCHTDIPAGKTAILKVIVNKLKGGGGRKKNKRKIRVGGPRVRVHACNPSTEQAEVEGY